MAHQQRFNGLATVNGSSATVQRFGDDEWLISNGSMATTTIFFLFGFLFFFYGEWLNVFCFAEWLNVFFFFFFLFGEYLEW